MGGVSESGIMLNYSLVEDLEVGPESNVNRAGEADFGATLRALRHGSHLDT